MAENQDGAEKSEDATEKKKTDARKEGNVAKSQDLSSGVMILASVLILYYYTSYFFKSFQDLITEVFQVSRFHINSESALFLYNTSLVFLAKVTLPFFAAIFVIAVIISVYQVGFFISGKAIEPKFDKLNFFTNFVKTFFNKRKFVDLIKSLIKIFVVGWLAWYIVSDELETFVRMTDADYRDQMEYLTKLLLEIGLKLGLLVLFVGIADYAYQKWQHNEDIKMTKQEIKEEYKQMEGDPMIKNRIRQAQREAARQRMTDEVPKADVVVTNPTHYAVAIRYNINEDRAPKVIAKGQRLLALKIKEIARQNGVKVHEDPPLARTLFNSVDIDEEIPENLYKALAEILMTLEKFKRYH